MAVSQRVERLPINLDIRCNHVFPSPEECVPFFSSLKRDPATKSQRREKTRRTVNLGNHLVVALGLARGIYKMKESEGTITFKSPLEKKKNPQMSFIVVAIC